MSYYTTSHLVTVMAMKRRDVRFIITNDWRGRAGAGGGAARPGDNLARDGL